MAFAPDEQRLIDAYINRTQPYVVAMVTPDYRRAAVIAALEAIGRGSVYRDATGALPRWVYDVWYQYEPAIVGFDQRRLLQMMGLTRSEPLAYHIDVGFFEPFLELLDDLYNVD